mgnify:CR=1 FL=1
MRYLLIPILAVLMLTGCSKDTVEGNDLLGTWQWVETSGGMDGTIESPQTTGNDILLEITETSIKRYINGDLESDLTYTLQTGESIRGGQREIISYENDWKQSVELSGNQLILYDECYDCYQHEYIKE